MSETETSFVPEHIFEIISNLAEFYLKSDLDSIAREKLDNDLKYLELLRQHRSRNRDIKRIQGLASQIIPHFYIARALASKNVPRNLEYYQNMERSRNSWGQIRGVIRARPASSQDKESR